MRTRLAVSISVNMAALLGLAAPTLADDPPSTEPPSVPVTRSELKRALEDSKRNAPRLPLPPLTAEERERAEQGDWTVVNNSRMRRHYLPAELASSGLGGLTRDSDPVMSLGYPFHTKLFWIVSRVNNCSYCLGHQESKLAAEGLPEDLIAALDGDWSEFSEAERAAFALTRKLTFEPHRVGPDDTERLRRHYTDKQILEIIFVVANFNAMNRWTGALRIPQEEHRVYLTPTSSQYRDRPSRVAPLDPGLRVIDSQGRGQRPGSSSTRSFLDLARRLPLESRAEVEAALAACRRRTARLPLANEVEARAVLPADWAPGPLPEWVRLLANFPKDGGTRIAMRRAAEEKGVLDARLKAQVAWIAARRDRAWYALGHAKRRLAALGLSEDAIYALDEPRDAYTPAERAAFTLARKLTVYPPMVTDADIAGLRESYTDAQVAELVHHITEAAFFDRITEASGLQFEGSP